MSTHVLNWTAEVDTPLLGSNAVVSLRLGGVEVYRRSVVLHAGPDRGQDAVQEAVEGFAEWLRQATVEGFADWLRQAGP